MALKRYTLYFKGRNKYGHEHNVPIISLDLKTMDEYTSNFNGYLDLFNSFPERVVNFIKENLSYMIELNSEDVLSKCIFITDNDFSPLMDVIFKADEDVLTISEEELTKKIVSTKMSLSEFENALLKSSLNRHNNKYEFFKYLYDAYVKDKKISCMIDVYDVARKFPNLSLDELMIAAIATDKDNIIILCKKLGQRLESRRNLAFRFKNLFRLMGNENVRITNVTSNQNHNLNDKELYDKIIVMFDSFMKKYDKEYLD
jgi:hypothetical protein